MIWEDTQMSIKGFATDNIRVKAKPRAQKQDAIQSIILSSKCFQDESLSVCQRILSDTVWNFILFRLFCFLSFKLSLTFGDTLRGYLPYFCRPPLRTFYLSLSAMVLLMSMPNSSFRQEPKHPVKMFSEGTSIDGCSSPNWMSFVPVVRIDKFWMNRMPVSLHCMLLDFQKNRSCKIQ